MYGSSDMERNRQNFFVILDCFFPFYPPMDPENQNFEKMKKNTWRHYHFTNVYHKWQSYDVWFLRYGVQQTEFFVIWTLFCSFTLLTTWKIKILKKWKKHLEISPFYTSAINDNHMIYGSSDMKRDGRNFFVILDYFLHFYPSKNLEKSKLRKNEKITWSYYHFTQVHQKSWSYAILFLRYGTWWT